MAKARDYDLEYDSYHKKPEQKKNRAKRNAGRRKVGLKKGDPRVAGHKKSLMNGGSNEKGNIEIVSDSSNVKKKRHRRSSKNRRLQGRGLGSK